MFSPIDSKTFYPQHSISEMHPKCPSLVHKILGRPVQFRFGITFWIPRIYRIFSRPSNEDRLSYRNVHPVLDTETISYHRRILCGRVILSVFRSLPLSFFFFLSRMVGRKRSKLEEKERTFADGRGDRSFRSDGTLILWKIANKPRPYFLPPSVPSFLPSFLLLLPPGRPLCLKGIFLFRLFLQGGRRSLS